MLGGEIAKAAVAQKIEVAVFDRGGYLYTGSVAAVAEGAREGGLKF
jgi:large subunit ribosomal protein L18